MGGPRCHVLTEHDGLIRSPCELALRPGVLRTHGSKTMRRSIRYYYRIVVGAAVANQIYRRRRTFFGSHCFLFLTAEGLARSAWRCGSESFLRSGTMTSPESPQKVSGYPTIRASIQSTRRYRYSSSGARLVKSVRDGQYRS